MVNVGMWKYVSTRVVIKIRIFQSCYARVVRVALVSYSCRLCSTRIALVSHSCRLCLTSVALLLLVSHSYRSCLTRVARVWCWWLDRATQIQHERHKCDASATWTTRMRHECYTKKRDCDSWRKLVKHYLY